MLLHGPVAFYIGWVGKRVTDVLPEICQISGTNRQ